MLIVQFCLKWGLVNVPPRSDLFWACQVQIFGKGIFVAIIRRATIGENEVPSMAKMWAILTLEFQKTTAIIFLFEREVAGEKLRFSGQSSAHCSTNNMGGSQSIASRILLLGIDGAGKTSFLNKYENPGEAQEQVQPTDGFIVKDVKVKGVKLNVWDVAGKEATRSLWKHYYEQGHTDAIIWVVDSADSQERLEESRTALQGALLDPHLQGTLYFYVWFLGW